MEADWQWTSVPWERERPCEGAREQRHEDTEVCDSAGRALCGGVQAVRPESRREPGEASLATQVLSAGPGPSLLSASRTVH